MTTTQPEAQPITPGRPGRDGQPATPVVAFLGTGRMGGPMAANLARGGLGVRVWNRHEQPGRGPGGRRRGRGGQPGGSRPRCHDRHHDAG